MALVINDRVKEISTTTGTGPVVFNEILPANSILEEVKPKLVKDISTIYNQDTNQWEVGLGTLNAGATTLARTTVITSSNSDNLVDFTSGTKDVFCTLPASKAVYLDADGKAVGVEGGNIETLGDTFSNYNDINTNTTTTLVATKNAFLAGIITISASAVWTIGGTGTLTII